jgi:putative ABC transport system permease protein
VPIATLQKKITGQDWLRWIMVSATSRQASCAAREQITSLLRDRHRIRAGQDDDFIVRNLADMADLANRAGSIMTTLLASIASVSLIVGGIGIMNIMLCQSPSASARSVSEWQSARPKATYEANSSPKRSCSV